MLEREKQEPEEMSEVEGMVAIVGNVSNAGAFYICVRYMCLFVYNSHLCYVCK